MLSCLPLTFGDPVFEQTLLKARCKILEQSGRYDEALSLSERYLTMREAAQIWHIRGQLLQRQQRLREALDHYLKALEIGSCDDYDRNLTRLDVIKVAAQLNNTALARKHYELLDEQEIDQLAYFDLPAAEKEYRKLLQEPPHSRQIRGSFAKMLRHAGKRSAEMALWQEQLSQQPEDIEALEQLACLLYRDSQYEEAGVNFKQALSVESSASCWWGLGLSQRKLGLLAASIDSFQQALTRYKEGRIQQVFTREERNPLMELSLDLAFAYHANKQADAALAIAAPAWHFYQQENKRYPDSSKQAYQYLRACVARRKPEATLSALKNLLLLIPEKRQAHLEWLQDDADMQFVREQEACRDLLLTLEVVEK